MNLLSIVENYGLNPKKHSTSKGGEYCSPCPRCGGNDRFIIQPNHNGGRYFCRQKDSCGTSGDAIQFLIDFQNMSFREAAAQVGKQLEDRPYNPSRRRHSPPREEAPEMQACEKLEPVERWRRQAAAQVGAAHKALLKNEERLKWLAARGLDIEAVERFKLGWIEDGIFEPLADWGLPMEKNLKGNDKKVWLPKGYLIPQWNLEGHLTMLQVRLDELLPDSDMRYYPVKGSTVTPMTIPPEPSLPPGRTAWVPVESRLDAMLIAHHAGDLVGTMALGNNSANPDPEAMPLLDASPLILNSLDFDEAGESSFEKWARRFKTAKRWPVPEGKDPGEYTQDHNGDIREWILAGLPPGLRIERKLKPVQEDAFIDPASMKPEANPDIEMRSKCGRDIFITDNPKQLQQWNKEGKITFSYGEMEKVKLMAKDAEVEDLPSLIEGIINLKVVMGGGFIKERINL